MTFSRAGLVVIVFAAGASSRAADLEERVAQAVQRGARALRQLQQQDGAWGAYGAGSTSLAALALLESGAAPDDAAVRRAADAVRRLSVTDTHVYNLALALLLLDRLGDARDVPLIQA